MMFPKAERIRDRKWLNAHRDFACAACGASDGTVIPAHIRAGHEGGAGLKPGDDLVIPLCHACHMDQEAHPGADWWLENVLKPQARRRYQFWKGGL